MLRHKITGPCRQRRCSECASRRSIGHASSEPQQYGAEPLEGRLLLAGDATLQLLGYSSTAFVQNQGQWPDSSIRYALSEGGVNVGMTDTGADFQLFRDTGGSAADTSQTDVGSLASPVQALSLSRSTQITSFSVSFLGAVAVDPLGLDPAPDSYNFLLGDQGNWRLDVPAFKTIRYPGLYPGIDLTTSGRPGGLKYDFIVAPGADYRQIQVRYAGIEALSLDGQGALHLSPARDWPEIVDDAPHVYQLIDGKQVGVDASFQLIDSHTYGFSISGPYDPAAVLIIDPDLAWSTYLGGVNYDYGTGIAVDGSGNVLVTGYTYSPDWTSGGFGTTLNGPDNRSDAFVAKLSPDGQHLWSTYLGGADADSGYGIAVDGSGNVLISGVTYSADWTSGGFDTTYHGSGDAFVVKLSPDGQHLWSTYLGDFATDVSMGIAVDGLGNALVTGYTQGGFGEGYNGGWDAFVAKLSPDGQNLWSTYLGGADYDNAYSVAVDSLGNVLVAGYTNSADWTSGGFDTTYNGGDFDGFVAKLSPDGQHLWSTYLGGWNTEQATAIAVDGSGNVLVAGTTSTTDWTSGGFDTSYNGGTFDAFVAKLTADGQQLWSTYLGGSNAEEADGIAVDASGNVLASGYTNSADWVSGGFDTTYNGGTFDAFVAELTADGQHLWSTYLGGSDYDIGYGVCVDNSGNVLASGSTNSTDWTSGGFDTTYNGGTYDAFVARITTGDADLTDTADPLAQLNPIATIAKGGRAHQFEVVYSDDTEVDFSTLGAGDIRVSGPGGSFVQVAQFLSATLGGDGASVIASYRITPPGGKWDVGDNGKYKIFLVADQVADASGNFAAAVKLGSFKVAVPRPSAPELRVYQLVKKTAKELHDHQAAAIDFGSVGVNSKPPMIVFRVTNAGAKTLTLGAVSLPKGFRLMNSLVASLRAGASDTFSVQLLTTAASARGGFIRFKNNDADNWDGVESPFDIPIKGVIQSGQSLVSAMFATAPLSASWLTDGSPTSTLASLFESDDPHRLPIGRAV